MKRNFLTILITGLIISIMWINAPRKDVAVAVDVLTITPTRKNIYDYVNAQGRIKEGNKRNIYVKNIGSIGDIFVSEGESVKKGTPLFEIDTVAEDTFSSSEYMQRKNEIYEVFGEYGITLPDIASFSYFSEEDEIITSPIDGIVTDINIVTGENVNVIKKLVSVSDFSDLYIETLIPEAYSSKIEVGTEVSIGAEAFGDTVYSGKIESIEPVAKYIPSITGEGKTYISAVVRTNSPNSLFVPESTVNAKIKVNTIKDALTIPYECVRQDDDGNEYVFCINREEKVFKQKIKTGYELENEVEVKSGINKDSRIIFNPDDTLEEDTLINVLNDNIVFSENS